ncbi:MAG: hypothetical protein HRT88_17335, partial [Lentisphaeraceae bacterium]|nr:hypothetical protein [Lentisphaeraceae bacterium]
MKKFKRKMLLCISSVLLICSGSLQAADSTNNLSLLIKTLSEVKDTKVQASLLRGILDGLAGVKGIETPDNWQKVNASLLAGSDNEVKVMTRQLSQLFGDEAANNAALKTLMNSKKDLSQRRAALASLVKQKHKELLPLLQKLLLGKLKIEVIRAFAAYDSKQTPRILLKQYRQFDAQSRRVVIETLASRKKYARALLKALKKGLIKKKDIPAYVAQNLNNLLGKTFIDVYGPLQGASDKAKMIAKFKAKL